MALPTTDDTTWTSIVAAAAETQMNAVIDIYKPGPPTPYDPVADTGGVPTLVPVETAIPARAVFIRRPQEFNSSIDWTVSRPVRVQIPRSYADTPILAGYVIRFTDGGDDINLTKLSLEVMTAANGSLAAVRTIECRTSVAITPVVS